MKVYWINNSRATCWVKEVKEITRMMEATGIKARDKSISTKVVVAMVVIKAEITTTIITGNSIHIPINISNSRINNSSNSNTGIIIKGMVIKVIISSSNNQT